MDEVFWEIIITAVLGISAVLLMIIIFAGGSFILRTADKFIEWIDKRIFRKM